MHVIEQFLCFRWIPVLNGCVQPCSIFDPDAIGPFCDDLNESFKFIFIYNETNGDRVEGRDEESEGGNESEYHAGEYNPEGKEEES